MNVYELNAQWLISSRAYVSLTSISVASMTETELELTNLELLGRKPDEGFCEGANFVMVREVLCRPTAKSKINTKFKV